MIFTETFLKGSHVVELQPLADERGWFARTYCKTNLRGLATIRNGCK